MLVKDILILFLKEKQNQLMRQYAKWEELQGEFPADYNLYQSKMDRADAICERIRRKIFELENIRINHDE